MDEATGPSAGVVSEAGEDHSGLHKQERQGNQQAARQSLRTLPRLPQFWTIGRTEIDNVLQSLKRPLSGYIGGNSRAGYWIERLADEWCETFGCRYAVPCNSATSGLLAACLAANIEEGDLVWVSDYTMSASATCALLLGAEVKFLDITSDFFTLTERVTKPFPKVIIVTNLFGSAASLIEMRQFCDYHGIILIEDNAQAPFATHKGRYTGTIGHIGVFSLNVHKHLQTGEGGVIVTNDPQLAHKLDCAINHGELMRTNPSMGLNLRMTEPIAAIASAQLKKGSQIVQSRIRLAEAVTDCFAGIDFVEPPRSRPESVHVYYLWAGKILGAEARRKRNNYISRLRIRGVPFRAGYSPPLHRLFEPAEFEKDYPVTCEMEDERLFVFEICAYDPKAHHLKVMKRIIQQEAERLA